MLSRLLQVVFGALCLLLVAAWLLLFTQGGSRYLVGLVSSATDLEIDYGGGRPFDGLRLARLDIPTDVATIILRDVRARAEPACLWRVAVCLEYLQVADVEVIVPDESVESDDEELPLWPLPFPVQSEQVRVEQLRVHWSSGSLTSDGISASARVFGEEVHLRSALASAVLLVIENDESDAEPAQLPEVDLPLELVVDELLLPDSAWLIDGLRNEYSELAVSGRWQGRELELHSLALANHQWGTASLVGSIEFLHPYSLSASGEYHAAEPDWWQGLHGSKGRVVAEGDLAALTLQFDQCGVINGQGTVVLDLLSPGLPLELVASGGCTGKHVPLPIASLPGLETAPDVVLGSDWALAVSGDLNTQAITLDANLSTYGQELRLVTEVLHQEQQLTVSRAHVSPVNDESQHLSFSGSLDYRQNLRWDVLLSLESLVFPAQWMPVPGELSGSAVTRGSLEDGSWSLSVDAIDLAGQVNNWPVAIVGQLHLDSAWVSDGTAIHVRSGADLLQLRDTATTSPQASLTVTDLGVWISDAQGRVAATLNWDPATRRLIASGDAQGVSWNAFRARELNWQANVDVASEIGGQVQVTLNQALLGENRLQEVQLRLQGKESDHQLGLEFSGDVTASAKLSGSLLDGDWRGELAPMSLQSSLGAWRLDRPVALAYLRKRQQLSLADHCWQGDLASLCTSDALLGYDGAMALDITGSLQDFDDLLPQRYTVVGDLEGRLQARWTALQPERVTARLRLGEGSVTETLLEAQRAYYAWDSLTLNYEGGSAEGRLMGQLMRNSKAQFVLDLSMPTARDGALSGGLEIDQLELSELRPFVPALSRIQGVTGGSVRFGGTVGNPDIKGEITLLDGSFSIAGNPTQVNALAVNVNFLGDHADISGGLEIGDGSSDITGRLRWDAEPALVLDLRGSSKPLLYPTDTVVYAAEDLQLRISESGMSLQGDVAVLGGEIVLDEIPEAAAEISEDVVLLDYTGQETRPTASSPVSLNVRVSIEEPLVFRTEGVQAKLAGELLLERASGEPLLVLGKLDVPEGRFELLGPRFDVTRGQIVFVGALDDPELDLAMEREITEDQVTVGIKVSGSAQLPKLDFYSRPALPEAEVMAYALSGRGVDRHGAGDGLGLAMAMTSSLMHSTGLLSGVSLGVEGKDTSTRAVVGGYVSERIYLSYGVGLYEPINTLTVRLDILHNLWMEVVSSLRSSADVYYSWSTP